MKTNIRFWRMACIGLGALGFVTAQAQGQNAPGNLLQPFEICAVIEEALERVACFDGALLKARNSMTRSVEMKSALEKGEEGLVPPRLALSSREKTETGLEPSDDFGKSAALRNKDRREIGLKPEEPEELTAKILSHRYDVYGKLTVNLDNGQIWQSTGKSGIKKITGNDDIVKIRKSSFGGYRLQVEGKRAQAVVKRIK